MLVFYDSFQTIRHYMVDISIQKKRLERVIHRLPSLSTTAMKVIEVCDTPTVSPNDLNRIISLDPVLTGQVLKLINSAYYTLPHKITSLTRAIIMLGINTVKNLVIGSSVLGSIGGKSSFKAISSDDFWEHSLCVGVLAKLIAGEVGVSKVLHEEYFMAGLLHDLGKIPLNAQMTAEYEDILKLSEEDDTPIHKLESKLLGFNHYQVGAMIATIWKLHGSLMNSIRHHHHPENADPEHKTITQIIALSDLYAYKLGFGERRGDQAEEALSKSLLSDLQLTDNRISGLKEDILEEIEKAKVFLQLSKKG